MCCVSLRSYIDAVDMEISLSLGQSDGAAEADEGNDVTTPSLPSAAITRQKVIYHHVVRRSVSLEYANSCTSDRNVSIFFKLINE